MIKTGTIKKAGAAVICFIFFIVISTTGCYYDKEELLYPQTSCDTATVTYSGAVAPILSVSCINGCHSGAAPSGGISLAAYADVKVQVNNGRLWGAVSHTAGFSPMPKNSSKLNSCSLTKIKKWIDAGAPNN